MLKKLDLKTIFILILAAALIISIMTRRSKPIDNYEDKIEQLEEKNKNLLLRNDSLKIENAKLDKEVQKLLIDIDKVQDELDETNDKVNDLENGKGKVSGYVKSLNADGVSKSLTEYLNRRTEK